MGTTFCEGLKFHFQFLLYVNELKSEGGRRKQGPASPSEGVENVLLYSEVPRPLGDLVRHQLYEELWRDGGRLFGLFTVKERGWVANLLKYI